MDNVIWIFTIIGINFWISRLEVFCSYFFEILYDSETPHSSISWQDEKKIFPYKVANMHS